MNDPLLDTIQEKQRLFNQIETLKKEATSLVDDAIRRTISSPTERVETLKQEATFLVDDAIRNITSSPAEMVESLKQEATFTIDNAITLFKHDQISSGMAAKWLNMPRITFLMLAMEAGVELLDNTPEDFERETALL